MPNLYKATQSKKCNSGNLIAMEKFPVIIHFYYDVLTIKISSFVTSRECCRPIAFYRDAFYNGGVPEPQYRASLDTIPRVCSSARFGDELLLLNWLLNWLWWDLHEQSVGNLWSNDNHCFKQLPHVPRMRPPFPEWVNYDASETVIKKLKLSNLNVKKFPNSL